MDTSLLASDSIFMRPKFKLSPSEEILELAKRNHFFWDVELTNRCNAQCYFCPRDKVPEYGHMTVETMRLVIDRIAEISPPGSPIGGCGQGDSLINPDVLEFVRYGADKGFEMSITTNGLHLNRITPESLLDAGLKEICFSISETEEAYTEMYKIPYEEVIDNIRRFRDAAKDRCTVKINHVITDETQSRTRAMRKFWESEGITEFNKQIVVNRGGGIAGKEERYRNSPFIERAQEIVKREGFHYSCWLGVFLPYISFDGYFYICCSDWSKVHRIGHISEINWYEALAKRVDLMNTPTSICHNCDHNVQNRLVDCFEYDHEHQDEYIQDIIEDRKKEEKLIDSYLDHLGK